jgi:hypothetical protein
LLSGNALSWFASFLEKTFTGFTRHGSIETLFIAAFDDRDRKKVVETKMQSLRQRTWSAAIYAA